MKVKCLSLWQPWASLMALGHKTVETRSWHTMVRAKIYIHAAKTLEGIKYLNPLAAVKIEDALCMTTYEMVKELPFGALVCKGFLYECVDAPSALRVYSDQEHFGDFSEGRFAHLYRDIKEIDPIPVRGLQGFFFADIEPQMDTNNEFFEPQMDTDEH